MRRTALPILACAAVLTLAGCGYTPGQRAVSGGVLGAAGGAGVSALADGDPLTGALIGGLGGAALGALTAPPQYDGYYDDRPRRRWRGPPPRRGWY